MKEANLAFRTEQEVKDKLEEYALECGLSMSKFVEQVIVDYPDHRQAVNEVIRLKNDVKRLEAEAATLKVPRLEVLYDELHGKQVGKRVIGSKADLLAVLAEEFRYQEQESSVTVTSVETPVSAVVYEVPTAGPFSFQKAAFMVASLIALVLTAALAWRWGGRGKEGFKN